MNTEISPQDLKSKDKEKILLIDVRTPGEFNSAHIADSLNLPLQSETYKSSLSTLPTDRNLIVVCQSGGRAKTAYNEISKIYSGSIAILQGGIQNWEKSGLPLIRGKKAVSMERQVRIAAGSFVLIGSLLAAFLSPNFIILPIFVGAGLIFSGVTDTCGMAIILGKMPWNSATTTRCCSINNDPSNLKS